MEDRLILILLVSLILLLIGGIVAIGVVYGWDAEIEMCWDYYSSQWEPCY